MKSSTIIAKIFIRGRIHTILVLLSLLVFTDGSLKAQSTMSDDAILKLYEGLRVADVSDGMDMAGLADVG